LTTGDSSLSACIQSIVAAEVGAAEKAMGYARYAVLMDLADIGGNMADGCHIASMGGTWMVATYGFAGMRDYDGHISFDPKPPQYIDELSFPLTIRGQRLRVEMTRREATYLLEEGIQLEIAHQGKKFILTEGEPVSCRIKTAKKTRKAVGKSQADRKPEG
jgi:alpha,alpha-trehalose phosphorylase